MAAFRYAHATGKDWREAADRSLTHLAPCPEAANLGFLYVTDALVSDMDGIVECLRAGTGIEHWIGTVGVGICATGVEYYDEPAMAVMLGEFPAGSFRVFSGVVSDLETFDAQHGQWVQEHEPYFAIVHGDPRNHRTEQLVEDLSDRLESGFLVGGLASSRGAFQQYADVVTEGGLSGVLFTGQVSVSTRLSQGCCPIGPRREITECEGNVLIAIDGESALEVFKSDIGEVLARDLRRTGGYIFAGLPIEGSDTGDYLVRNVVGMDPENGYLAIGEIVDPGQPLMFCKRDPDTAREDLTRVLKELRSGLKGPPLGAVYYSCLGRGASLFGADSAELRILRDVLGEFPVIGFYANGEISHDRLYGYTGVLTLFL